jgi:hypothetical protein
MSRTKTGISTILAIDRTLGTVRSAFDACGEPV